MNAATCIAESKAIHRVPISERLRLAWKNRSCWKIRLALAILRRAFRKDPGFRLSWHANIAMPIYDATRPKCHCAVLSMVMPGEHHPDCQLHQSCIVPARFGCKDMPIEQANHIAELLMKHLFE